MNNYYGRGAAINFTNATAAAIVSGEVVPGPGGGRIGIATTDIAIGATGALCLEGEFTLQKTLADVAPVLSRVYWDAATKKVTNDAAAGANAIAGIVTVAAGNGDATVVVKIDA